MPRGQYRAERAAQLSGVPQRTLYHWASEGYLVPDFDDAHPKMWSYRDLIFVRLFVWLRSKGFRPGAACKRVEVIRHAIEVEDLHIAVVRAGNRRLLLNDETFDRITGDGFLPIVFDYLDAFNLEDPSNIPEVGRGPIRGPNLVRPSEYTSISPWVMSGEPCVRRSRIPTASLFALQRERGLTSSDIVQLYSHVTIEAVDDAIELEERLRNMSVAA